MVDTSFGATTLRHHHNAAVREIEGYLAIRWRELSLHYGGEQRIPNSDWAEVKAEAVQSLLKAISDRYPDTVDFEAAWKEALHRLQF